MVRAEGGGDRPPLTSTAVSLAGGGRPGDHPVHAAAKRCEPRSGVGCPSCFCTSVAFDDWRVFFVLAAPPVRPPPRAPGLSMEKRRRLRRLRRTGMLGQPWGGGGARPAAASQAAPPAPGRGRRWNVSTAPACTTGDGLCRCAAPRMAPWTPRFVLKVGIKKWHRRPRAFLFSPRCVRCFLPWRH
ncbi:hypothetical protein I4F81_008530 [Pyropia yezoensis]|uniref:Uncharacterized protein n=1 Tax=Pyropia yezoensis TaxID=2788 RepID=A0ACC3C797_PYRYE|nr:hypothetical protein I4F81_008530 [Neopyropia yezoensis]